MISLSFTSFVTDTANIINGFTAGLVMREAVRRAMQVIRKERFIFEAQIKTVDYKRGKDLVTSADFKAQDLYLEMLQKNFPLAGIVAEESFACPCTDPGLEYFFTVDPLDGTKAFGRRQSEGIATMIALVIAGKVEGICIGDVMTGEVYYSRPFSKNANRISEYETTEQLSPEPCGLPLRTLLLRDDPRAYSPLSQGLSWRAAGLFKNIEVTGGSIGLSFAKLWKGQIGGVLLKGKQKQMPWDLMPCLGISEKLGYGFYALTEKGLSESRVIPQPEPIYFSEEVLVVHHEIAPTIDAWVRRQG